MNTIFIGSNSFSISTVLFHQNFFWKSLESLLPLTLQYTMWKNEIRNKVSKINLCILGTFLQIRQRSFNEIFVQVPTSKIYRNVRDNLHLEHCTFHTFFRETLFLPLRMLDSFPFPVFSFSLLLSILGTFFLFYFLTLLLGFQMKK